MHTEFSFTGSEKGHSACDLPASTACDKYWNLFNTAQSSFSWHVFSIKHYSQTFENALHVSSSLWLYLCTCTSFTRSHRFSIDGIFVSYSQDLHSYHWTENSQFRCGSAWFVMQSLQTNTACSWPLKGHRNILLNCMAYSIVVIIFIFVVDKQSSEMDKNNTLRCK